MKNTLFTLLIGLLGFGLVESTSSAKQPKELTWKQLVEREELRELQLKRLEEDRIKKYHEEELTRFLYDIGHRESGNRYDIVNRFGYMGRYQFGKATLKGLGFDVTKKEFLNTPELQDSAMMALLNHNKEKLQEYIDIYDGKTIHGLTITESGILAAAHLGGQGSVKRFFKNGKVFKDANGTRITSYMKQFSGYDIKLN